MRALEELADELLVRGLSAFRAIYSVNVLVYTGHVESLNRDFHTRIAFQDGDTAGARIRKSGGPREGNGRVEVLSRVFPITKRVGGSFPDRIGVGRSHSVDVSIPFALVSKYHGYFEQVDDHWYFTDSGSKNGSRLDFVELLPRQRQPIRDGMKLHLGPNELSFRSPEGLMQLLASMARERG